MGESIRPTPSPGAHTPSLQNQLIGAYRIVTDLGGGGMGSVWYAEHARIGRRVAIKVLHPELSRDASQVQRFLDEARAVNAIRHPNIVDITDFGEHGGLTYLVMELLEGETLGARLEREGSLDPSVVIKIAAQIALALGAAHEHGIVHRDLKPENVFLCSDEDFSDRVKLLDFGIAKLSDGVSNGANRTNPGMILGTPLYMSPEQCFGAQVVDPRSDQYSLGVVIFEMLTGRLPFQAQSFLDLRSAHNTQPVPSIRKLNRGVSPTLEKTIVRALSKEPSARFLDMREFAEALRGRLPAPSETPVNDREQEIRTSHAVGSELNRILHRQFTSGRAKLPALPTVVGESLRLLAQPDTNIARVAESIGRDPLASTRLMKLVNSPVYRGRAPVTTLRQAIARVGIRQTKSLLVSLSARQLFVSNDPGIRETFDALWRHCLAVGLIAKAIAKRAGGVEPETAYLAGLLHDIGKPVAAAYLLEAERATLARLGTKWMNESLWLRIISRCQADAGRALAARWRLPPQVAAAIGNTEYNHKSPKARCANMVRYADALARLEGMDVGDIDVDAALAQALEGRHLFALREETELPLTADVSAQVHALSDPDAVLSTRPPNAECPTATS